MVFLTKAAAGSQQGGRCGGSGTHRRWNGKAISGFSATSLMTPESHDCAGKKMRCLSPGGSINSTGVPGQRALYSEEALWSCCLLITHLTVCLSNTAGTPDLWQSTSPPLTSSPFPSQPSWWLVGPVGPCSTLLYPAFASDLIQSVAWLQDCLVTALEIA